MIRIVCQRFFHTSRNNMAAATKSSSLSKLRKSTGYPISNCKRAIELFPGDIEKAEEWLHSEAKQKGWEKWAKIQSRSATQGLIGVFSQDRIGVMVEVNCETDFVAKNAEFQQLVECILSGCVNHTKTCTSEGDVTKIVLGEARINELKLGSDTLGEITASAISKFNEKTVTRRAVCLKVSNDIELCTISHPATTCSNLPGATLGKYGSMLAFKKTKTESELDPRELGLNICQHIIGMNPLSVGQMSEQDLIALQQEKHSQENLDNFNEKQNLHSEDASENSQDLPDNEREGLHTLDNELKDTEETRLLYQQFLLDSNIIVGENLLKSGVEVVDFERFECGENCAEDTEALQSSSAAI